MIETIEHGWTITNALYAKNKIRFVDGIITWPSQNLTDLNLWLCVIKVWLKSAIDKEVHNSIWYATTGHEIWVDISERFEKRCTWEHMNYDELSWCFNKMDRSWLLITIKLKGPWDEMQAINPLPRWSCSNY